MIAHAAESILSRQRMSAEQTVTEIFQCAEGVAQLRSWKIDSERTIHQCILAAQFGRGFSEPGVLQGLQSGRALRRIHCQQRSEEGQTLRVHSA